MDNKINIQKKIYLTPLKIISNDENHLIVIYEKSKIDMKDLISNIEKQGINIIDISTDDGDLEDVFLRLTKN